MIELFYVTTTQQRDINKKSCYIPETSDLHFNSG